MQTHPYSTIGRRVALWAILVVELMVICLASASTGLCAESDQSVLGSEDVITVTVAGFPDLSGDFLIPESGTVGIPRAGQVPLAGKTLSAAADLIASHLSKTLREPNVTVTLKSHRPQFIYLMGAVQKPGPYNAKPDWPLMEAIGSAGGLPAGIEASDCTIVIIRAGSGARETVPLQAALRGEAPNKTLQPADVVYIESSEKIPVYVTGKVNHPGLYNMRAGSTGVMEAITVAGGTIDGNNTAKATVTHLSGESETLDFATMVPGEKIKVMPKLRAGDLVTVSNSESCFAVLGWVKTPGFFPLVGKQRVTLSDAIGMAQGSDNKRGGLSRVTVIRNTDGKEARVVCDLTKFLSAGDVSQNPQVNPGDIIWVPETSSPDWDKLTSKFVQGFSFFYMLNRINR